MKYIFCFVKDEFGVMVIEYGLIVVFIVVVIIGVVIVFGIGVFDNMQLVVDVFDSQMCIVYLE